jgi:hypothetical protein
MKKERMKEKKKKREKEEWQERYEEGWFKWMINKMQLPRCWETKFHSFSNHMQSDNKNVTGAS